MRSFTNCFATRHSTDHTKEDEMGGTCGIFGRGETDIGVWWGNSKGGGSHLED